MKIRNYIKSALLAFSTATLIGCSGGTCVPNSGNGLTLTLTLTAPNEYPAGVAVTAYLTMTNTSNVNANNLVYAIPDATNYTGTTITVDNTNNPCKTINAGQSCTFPAEITNVPTSHPGSFTVTATPNGSVSSTSSLSDIKSLVALKSDTLSLTANIGLTTLTINNQSGANGITFLYSQTIAASQGGPTQIALVGVVNSANAGTFNTINLTDSAGNLLNFKVLSNNSGNGASDLILGKVVTFLLTIPAGASSYQFYAQTIENGTKVDQGTRVNPINLGNPSSGILVVQPTNFNLYESQSYTSQVITYSNVGGAPITNLNITTPSGPFTLTNNCGSTLNVGASCAVTLKSNATSSQQGSGSVTATSSAGNVTSQFNYSGVSSVPHGCTAPNYCIFMTSRVMNGNFWQTANVDMLANPPASTGFAGGDYICKYDTNNPLGTGNGSWKALLNTNNSTTSGANYYRPDGTLIAQADSTDLKQSGNLDNPIVADSSAQVWTGFSNTQNCGFSPSASWQTDVTFMGPAGVGNAGATSATWWNNGTEACDTVASHLYCVQQSDLSLTVTNNSLFEDSCTDITATLSEPATSNIEVNFSVSPSATFLGLSGTPSCTIQNGEQACTASNLVCGQNGNGGGYVMAMAGSNSASIYVATTY